MLEHPGFVMWMGSDFSAPMPSNGVNIGGELVVMCTAGTLTRIYPPEFGTSSDGNLCFRGPHKGFPLHHTYPGQPFSNSNLFGYTPAGSRWSS